MTHTTKKYNALIWVLSILIPLVVAALFSVKLDLELPVFLPPVYAAINALTSLILITSFWAIRSNRRNLHERLMKSAVLLSALFLILYVLHHMTSESTKYGGEGILKTVYFIVLISHIMLSVAVIPFVLITFVRGLTGNYIAHKKIARYAFPLWLYVTVSGVLVYIMIAPYY